ncbi:MAG: hypothetical protein V4773_03065, partial [Verrucomicrobiota bacterium]
MSVRARPRIKFIWGASRVIQGRWYVGLFGFYVRVEGVPDSGLAISVRGLLCWMAVFAMVGYVTLASVLFKVIWLKNPYNRLTYTDALLYPLRRDEIAQKRGQAYLAKGMEFFQQQKFHDAATLLKLGLERFPEDVNARIMLAQYYQMANQRPLTIRTLREGLTDAYPGRRYVETLFVAAEQGEDYKLIVEVTARYLPQLRGSESAVEARWMIERRFAALTAIGRHEEALALAETEQKGDTAMEGRIVSLLALRRIPEAIKVVEEW